MILTLSEVLNNLLTKVRQHVLFPYDFKKKVRNQQKIDLLLSQMQSFIQLQKCQMTEFKDHEDYYPRNKK